MPCCCCSQVWHVSIFLRVKCNPLRVNWRKFFEKLLNHEGAGFRIWGRMVGRQTGGEVGKKVTDVFMISSKWPCALASDLEVHNICNWRFYKIHEKQMGIITSGRAFLHRARGKRLFGWKSILTFKEWSNGRQIGAGFGGLSCSFQPRRVCGRLWGREVHETNLTLANCGIQQEDHFQNIKW